MSRLRSHLIINVRETAIISDTITNQMVRKTEILFAVRAVNVRRQDPPLVSARLPAHSNPKYGNHHLVVTVELPETVTLRSNSKT